jgi:hypothetical protein
MGEVGILFVGMKEITATVGASATVNSVEWSLDSNTLEEVVVVGYGTQKKRILLFLKLKESL